MKIILLADIKALGKKGDIKETSEGYARNFLFPKNLAAVATAEAVKEVEAKKAAARAAEAAQNQKDLELGEKLKNQPIIILAKEKGGKLFGSITAKQVVEELGKKGLNISPDSVIMKKSIKTVGEHEINIELSRNISVKVQLEVESN